MPLFAPIWPLFDPNSPKYAIIPALTHFFSPKLIGKHSGFSNFLAPNRHRPALLFFLCCFLSFFIRNVYYFLEKSNKKERRTQYFVLLSPLPRTTGYYVPLRTSPLPSLRFYIFKYTRGASPPHPPILGATPPDPHVRGTRCARTLVRSPFTLLRRRSTLLRSAAHSSGVYTPSEGGTYGPSFGGTYAARGTYGPSRSVRAHVSDGNDLAPSAQQRGYAPAYGG